MAKHINKPKMSKAAIIAQLDVMVVERLFGDGPYFADEETSLALTKRFVEMGLEEAAIGESDTWRPTSLGKELNIWVLRVFMGLTSIFSICPFLDHHGLIFEEEEYEVDMRLTRGETPEAVFRPLVRKAYSRYFNSTNAMN